ncbi:ABC transporter permease [Sanguibacter suarezii]|uniref:ABC transporter permease n=1 Tax=Sanguibacter suarezii TaxID=60921 RepID=UPI0008344F24|nr:ABC transporter permease [Sanguibacter suarezii]
MTALRQYGLLTQWQLRRQSASLPILVVVQALLAVGTVLGFGIIMGEMSGTAALFLATGAPTVTLITVGLVMAPQMLSQAKTEGSSAWMMTLPVPRLAFLAADLTVWTLVALPGTLLALLAGVARYDIELSIAAWALPAAVLVSLTAAAVGYAMAAVLPPTIAQLMTQLLIFAILLFSPITFPADRLPDWLADLHRVLPVEPMAELVRAGLAQDTFTVPASSVAVLVAWCAGSVALAAVALRRRG